MDEEVKNVYPSPLIALTFSCKVRLWPVVSHLLVPGEKQQISQSTPTDTTVLGVAFWLSQLNDFGCNSLLTLSIDTLLNAGSLYRMCFYQCLALLGWMFTACRFCPCLDNTSFLEAWAGQNARGLAPFSPTKRRAQNNVSQEHSKGHENIFLLAPKPLDFPSLSDKNHNKCFLKNTVSEVLPQSFWFRMPWVGPRSGKCGKYCCKTYAKWALSYPLPDSRITYYQ